MKRMRMKINRRDIFVGVLAAGIGCVVHALTEHKSPIISSSIYDWNKIPATKTNIGEVRQFLKGPTATLDELEIHVTTLNAGEISHPPHKHQNEELVIVREGTVEALVSGEWKRVGPGSVIFNASNQLHGLRNVGAGPATYHVINWRSPQPVPMP
jgi:XRE family transcriptional regulator, regulator of sulfur utilization